MSKAIEYNEKIIKKQEQKVKEETKKYYKKRCCYVSLTNESKKLLNNYINLERIIKDELNNHK